MSTSSLIYLKTEENSSSFYYGFKNCFYRHYDGMPEVTGHDIAKIIQEGISTIKNEMRIYKKTMWLDKYLSERFKADKNFELLYTTKDYHTDIDQLGNIKKRYYVNYKYFISLRSTFYENDFNSPIIQVVADDESIFNDTYDEYRSWLVSRVKTYYIKAKLIEKHKGESIYEK